MDDIEIKKYIDFDAGIARVIGNKALYKKLLDLFAKSQEFDDLEAAIAKKDYDAAGKIAHAIKGMTGNLDMPALFNESAKLMQELRENQYSEITFANYRDALEKTLVYLVAVVEKLS